MMHVTDTPNGGRYPWVGVKVGENPIAIPSSWGNTSVYHLTRQLGDSFRPECLRLGRHMTTLAWPGSQAWCGPSQMEERYIETQLGV